MMTPPAWETFPPILLHKIRLVPLQAISRLLLTVGTPLVTLSSSTSFSSSSQGKKLWVWAQHSLSPISPQACQETVACAAHRGTRGASWALGRNLSSKKGYVRNLKQKKEWGPWKGCKIWQRWVPTQKLYPVPRSQNDQCGPPLVSPKAPYGTQCLFSIQATMAQHSQPPNSSGPRKSKGGSQPKWFWTDPERFFSQTNVWICRYFLPNKQKNVAQQCI